MKTTQQDKFILGLIRDNCQSFNCRGNVIAAFFAGPLEYLPAGFFFLMEVENYGTA